MNQLAANAESKANKNILAADKLLNSWFFGTSKKEQAMDLFVDAGNQLKIASEWQRAAECFVRAAELAEQLSSDMDASNRYQDAALCFKKANNVPEAVKMMSITIPMHLENGRMSMAAKLYKDMGDLYIEDGDEKSACTAYSDAAKCYSAEDRLTNSNECTIKVADIKANLKEYKEAVSLLEEVARLSLPNNLLKWKCKDYYFKSILCIWAEDISHGWDITETKLALDRYVELYPNFSSSREFKLINSIIEAYENGEIEKFTDAVFEFDNISPLDAWKSSTLLLIKQQMQNPSEPQLT